MQVAIHTGETPLLIAFREETSAQWQPVPATATGTYDIAASGPYRVVIACDPGDRAATIREYARTPEDSPMIEHTCASYPFRAHADVVGAGGLFLGDWSIEIDAMRWSVDLPAAAGSFDLVMLSASNSSESAAIANRRAVAITGDTQLGTLDMSREVMRPLVARTFSPRNVAPGEQTFSDTTLYAGNTIATIDSSFVEDRPSWSAKLAPDDALQPADHQVVSLSALMTAPMGVISQDRYRTVSQEAREHTPTEVVLPEPMGGASFEVGADRLVATWTSLPEHDEIVVGRNSMSDDGDRQVRHQAVFSASYLAATAATSVTLDLTDVPGLRPEWRQRPASKQRLSLFANRGSIYDSTSSGVVESLDAAPPRPPSVATRESHRGQPADRLTTFGTDGDRAARRMSRPSSGEAAH